jgi:aminoglycoside phosphotransferase (APT) family kinase protein
MQPDPRVFLPAIRREILRPDFLGKALTDGLTPILVMRAAEGLAQLELRQQRVPEILRALAQRQRSALAAAVTELASLRIARPAMAEQALALAHPSREPGEADVMFHDRHVEAISACIAVLSEQAAGNPRAARALQQLCTTSSQLEFEMRSAYQVVLTALKREHERAQSGEAPPRPAPSGETLTAVLRSRFPQHPQIEARELRPLPGANAQEIHFFELAHHPDWTGPMVLRRASEYNATRSSLANESELLDFLHTKDLPVARVLMAERDPSKLGGEFIVLERLPGKPQTAAEIGAHGRALMLEMATILARLHAIDPRELSKPYRADHGVGPAMQSLIERFYSRWQAERVDGSMVLESGFAWLRSNAALLDDRVSLVHGDCNLRNVLIDNGRVSALLDWELAHAGHAAEDLAYIRPDVEAIMPWGEFLDAYTAAGGRPVSAHALRYFDVWRDVWRTSMAACIYGAFIRGEHRSFIFGTVAFNEYYATLDTLASYMVNHAFKPAPPGVSS